MKSLHFRKILTVITPQATADNRTVALTSNHSPTQISGKCVLKMIKRKNMKTAAKIIEAKIFWKSYDANQPYQPKFYQM